MASLRTTHPGLPLPFRVKPSRSRPVPVFRLRSGQSPVRFLSPPAFSRRWAATDIPGVPRPGLRYLLSVSHALEVLIRPSPAGLVSCRSRSWGFGLSRSCSPCRAVRPLGRLYPLAVASRVRMLVKPASGFCSLRGSLSRPGSTGADSGLHRLLPPWGFPLHSPGAFLPSSRGLHW